jgi:hypothetical protein
VSIRSESHLHPTAPHRNVRPAPPMLTIYLGNAFTGLEWTGDGGGAWSCELHKRRNPQKSNISIAYGRGLPCSFKRTGFRLHSMIIPPRRSGIDIYLAVPFVWNVYEGSASGFLDFHTFQAPRRTRDPSFRRANPLLAPPSSLHHVIIV